MKTLAAVRTKKVFLFTACKNRSLGQGNVFARVCHFVHRGVGFLPLGPWGRGFCLWVWDVCAHTSEHRPPQRRHIPPEHTHTHTAGHIPPQRSTSRRYASYWKAFLFCSVWIIYPTLSHMNQNRLKGAHNVKWCLVAERVTFDHM